MTLTKRPTRPTHPTYQVDPGTMVGILTAVQVPPAALQESTSHVNVVVTEVKHQHLQAFENFRLGEHPKLDQLPCNAQIHVEGELMGLDMRLEVIKYKTGYSRDVHCKNLKCFIIATL